MTDEDKPQTLLRRLRWLRRLAGEDATPRKLLLAWFARGEGWPMRNFEGLASATERDWVASVKAATLDEGFIPVIGGAEVERRQKRYRHH